MSKQGPDSKANLKVSEPSEVKFTDKQQKQMQKRLDREEQAKKNYARSMVTRAEAFSIAEQMANKEVNTFADFIRDPIRAAVVQAMALTDLLIDKGIINNNDEFQVYLDKVQDKLAAQDQEVVLDGEAKDTSNTPVSEEEEEQQS
ncbi:hypothetical protein D3C74_51080 [compost metagenome]